MASTNQPDSFLINKDIYDGLKTIENKTVDMIFVDPPYFLSNGSFTVSNGKRDLKKINKGEWDKLQTFDEKYRFHQKWIKATIKKLKPNGTIWITGTYHSIYMCGAILQKLNFKILNAICWFKPNGSPNLSNRCFTASHELIIWAMNNNKSKHIYNFEKMKNFKKDKIHNHSKQMRSVWSIPNTPQREKKHGWHPTQKPIELLRRIILSSTNEGDLILDPFCGSGTTAVVAIQNNRKFICIDNDSKYYNIAKQRIDFANVKNNNIEEDNNRDTFYMKAKSYDTHTLYETLV